MCAAVSTLGYTFAAVVRRLDADGALCGHPLIREAEGELRVSAQAREAYRGALAQSFDTVKTGLNLLAENYPEHVRLYDQTPIKSRPDTGRKGVKYV